MTIREFIGLFIFSILSTLLYGAFFMLAWNYLVGGWSLACSLPPVTYLQAIAVVYVARMAFGRTQYEPKAKIQTEQRELAEGVQAEYLGGVVKKPRPTTPRPEHSRK